MKNSCSTKLSAVAASIISRVSTIGLHPSRKANILFFILAAFSFIARLYHTPPQKSIAGFFSCPNDAGFSRREKNPHI